MLKLYSYAREYPGLFWRRGENKRIISLCDEKCREWTQSRNGRSPSPPLSEQERSSRELSDGEGVPDNFSNGAAEAETSSDDNEYIN